MNLSSWRGPRPRTIFVPAARRRRSRFPHVKEAFGATVKGFDTTDRGQLIMACGTGKTLAAMWISERLDAKRTLILVPSLSLLEQTLREWNANATKPFDYLAVCSDETVAEKDEFVAHTSELGLPVTTDPDRIAAFLRRRGRRVVFATYQSSPQIAAAYSGRTPRFDLAVADEAHRCTGLVGSEFTTILDPDRIKAKRRLFMTATPRIYTRRVRREVGKVDDLEIASMDDVDVFGPELHRLNFGASIERDLLSDYQVVVVGVSDSEYRRWAVFGQGPHRRTRALAGGRRQLDRDSSELEPDVRPTIAGPSDGWQGAECPVLASGQVVVGVSDGGAARLHIRTNRRTIVMPMVLMIVMDTVTRGSAAKG